MCGYCIEASYFAYRLGMDDTPWDPIMQPVHLQEIHEWRPSVFQVLDEDSRLPLLGLCRALESVLLGHSTDAVEAYRSRMDGPAWNRLMAGIERHLPDASWAWIRNATVPDEDLLRRTQHLQLLDAYLDDTGGRRSWRGDALFWVVIAMALQERWAADDGVLDRLLSSEPSADGMALWVHRRTARILVRREGASALYEHGGDLRPSNIASLLLSSSISKDEAGHVIRAMAERSTVPGSGLHWAWSDPLGQELRAWLE